MTRTVERHEVWARGTRWRIITVHNPATVQYSWGHYDRPVRQSLTMFGGSLAAAMDGAHGQGSERWYEHTTVAAARERVERIRASARRAGFERLGRF